MTNASHNTTSIANKPLVFVWGMSVWAPQVLQIRGCSERFDDFNDKRARPPTTKIATSNSNGISQRSASIRVFLHNSSVRAVGLTVIRPVQLSRLVNHASNAVIFSPRSEEHTSELQSPLNIVC